MIFQVWGPTLETYQGTFHNGHFQGRISRCVPIVRFVELSAHAPDLLYQLEKTGRVITDETPGLSKKGIQNGIGPVWKDFKNLDFGRIRFVNFWILVEFGLCILGFLATPFLWLHSITFAEVWLNPNHIISIRQKHPYWKRIKELYTRTISRGADFQI